MTREEFKNLVKETVANKQGCKATELAANERFFLFPREHSLPEIIEELVEEGELVEVEYVLKALDFRIKSFLLPKGTEVHHRGAAT